MRRPVSLGTHSPKVRLLLPHWSRSHPASSSAGSGSSDPHPADPGPPPAWPEPDAVELADGSLVVSATAPRVGVVVVRAVGEIDILTAPAWRRTLGAATWIAASTAPPDRAPGVAPDGSGGPGPRLVCDLSATTFLGATGLAVLVELATQTGSAGVDLRVVTGSRAVRRLLGMTGLDHHLATETSLGHAVTSAPSS